jgi:aspartyl-tRNA(Asn)/glutamyl-tRNA(Gln) amidotransferase subunit A
VAEPAFLTLTELGRLLRDGQTTSLELTRYFLDRLERLGPRFGAVVTVLRGPALAEAADRDGELARGEDRGPLHGIPYGAKDLFAVRGAPTTWGAAPLHDQRFDHDATAITRLRQAGAVLVAKLAMVEIAGGMGYDEADASLTGAGRSPWNPDFWSGGSSSGSGAAVAAGLVPFALGSETWGSITTPAAFSGVTGLRPTYGRVSRSGAMALSWTMDKVGPLARTAHDAGVVLAAIAGPDPGDPSTVDRPYRYPESVPARRYRIGVLRDATSDIQPAVAANFEASLAVLADTADIVRDVELADHPYGAAAGLIIQAEAASIFEDFLDAGAAAQLTAPGSRTGGYVGTIVLAKDYLRAMRLRPAMQRDLDRVFAQYDAIATPTRGTVAYPVGVPFRDAYPDHRGGTAIGGAANLAGLPGVAVPNGFGDGGLPTSLSLTGRAWEENRVIAIATAYQERTDWHRRVPPGV